MADTPEIPGWAAGLAALGTMVGAAWAAVKAASGARAKQPDTPAESLDVKIMETLEQHEKRIALLEERDRRAEIDRVEGREVVGAIFKRLDRMDRGLARICGALKIDEQSDEA